VRQIGLTLADADEVRDAPSVSGCNEAEARGDALSAGGLLLARLLMGFEASLRLDASRRNWRQLDIVVADDQGSGTTLLRPLDRQTALR
jgi:hypothetical protein